jgi:hypothetical protein
MVLNTYPNFYNSVEISEVTAKFKSGTNIKVTSALANSSTNPSKTTIIFYPNADLKAGTYTDELTVMVKFAHTFSSSYKEAYFKIPVSLVVSPPVRISGSGKKPVTSATKAATDALNTGTGTTNNATGGGTGGTCFDAGTPVLMADGTHKNIEDIIIGDRVRSYNVYTNKFEESEVLKLHKIKENQNLVALTFSDGTILHTTMTHPFYTTSG